MEIAPFETEHFYARYEFDTPYQLCNSDCETVTVGELLALAGMSPADLADLSLGYTESQGNPRLREAIAAGYRTVTAGDVLVLGTPVEGIYLTARGLLNPGDEVVVLVPAYDALVNLFEHVAGATNVKRWRFVATKEGWELDFDRLQDLISSRTKVIVVNFPHNPTGFLPTTTQLEELAALAAAKDLLLFCDEMYYGLVHSGTPPIPSAAEVTPKAVVLSGLSKTYGLPGLRSGWLVVQDLEIRQNLLNWKFYTSICPPAPSEFLALAALSVRERLRERSVAQIEQNLALATAFFQRWPDLFVWHPPRAGSTALVRMNVPSVTEFAHTLAAEAGVLIHPAVTLGSDDQYMRIGLGRAGFGEALTKFEAYLLEKAKDLKG